MDIFTGTITTPLTITTIDGVYRLSYKAVGGPITVLGNIPFKGVSPSGQNIEEGNGGVIAAVGPQPINGFTIDPGANSAEVQIYF